MQDIGIITPVRNEEQNLPKLIESVINQTIKPTSWAIIDDNSTDASPEIISNYASQYEWISKLENGGSESYEMRANYSEVLKVGYKFLIDKFGDDIDYYLILDGDMEISSNYVEGLAKFLNQSQEIVIASGGIYLETENGLKLEKRSKIHPAGGATLYDGDFYRSIGGPPVIPGVDAATEIKARTRGFECRYLSSKDIKAIQSRPTGSKGSTWNNMYNRGYNSYVLGTTPSTMLIRSVWMCKNSPHYRGLPALIGYLRSMLSATERTQDKEILRYQKKDKKKEMVKNFKNIVNSWVNSSNQQKKR
ncbi:glycosyltransferase family 2 protein [Salinigranum halophilum]|uniref:glycosyltransferase family 2 protein n=1 Tax=Salinigranum halophilum TaxID=2565931 RepID=UPI0010A91C65|nr:glycosyltransferase family 2 protein [Salinigranum halophilum]